MLSVNNVDITIDKKQLLSDITFEINQGKLYGLIGHNGSGKSTLIKLLAGEYTASHGSVCVDNVDIQKTSIKALAKKIAYLPQKLPDAQSFTVAELVMLGRYPWQKWLQKPSAEDATVVHEAMQQTQIFDKKNQLVSTLSGGEKARAWLAMCLAQKTEYLLLDEPLAALDIVYQVEILTLIKKLATESNLGIVLIVHDINLAAKFCDDIIAMKQGEICHIGDTADTMQQDVLEKIFGIKLHVTKHPFHDHHVAMV